MRLSRFVRLAHLALVPMALAACESVTDPGVDLTSVPESELTFIRFAPDAAALADTVVSFWAVRGDNRRVEIRYRNGSGYDDDVCLEFRVPGDALHRRPDGSSFARGDSILITVRVVSNGQYKFEFEPAGLQFAPDKPARLRIDYDRSDRDYNGDGVIDERDEQIRQSFTIWRQERPGDPWTRVQSEREEPLKKVRADIQGFTRYALATN